MAQALVRGSTAADLPRFGLHPSRSHVLRNWRRLDPQGPIALGNIAVLQHFLGGLDEAWFVLVHVEIEARAAPALVSLVEAQEAVSREDPADVESHLTTVAGSLEAMETTLRRMPEGCDPFVYYHRVRPYIHGWKDHPALPEGVVYEGVDAPQGQPRHYRGETGAQSSIVPSLDAALGIAHADDPLRPDLLEMREYMPGPHRAFIAALESGPAIREYVLQHGPPRPALRQVYNQCLQGLARFRSQHLAYAHAYIQRQAGPADNPTTVGTGGTPFMPYLKKHRDETLAHLL